MCHRNSSCTWHYCVCLAATKHRIAVGRLGTRCISIKNYHGRVWIPQTPSNSVKRYTVPFPHVLLIIPFCFSFIYFTYFSFYFLFYCFFFISFNLFIYLFFTFLRLIFYFLNFFSFLFFPFPLFCLLSLRHAYVYIPKGRAWPMKGKHTRSALAWPYMRQT